MADFGNVIKVELADAKEQFTTLLVGLANEKELNIVNVTVEDLYDAYHENEPQYEYFLHYEIKGKPKESLWLRMLHKQYDFNTNKLYGFYEVKESIFSRSIWDFEFGDYATEMSKSF